MQLFSGPCWTEMRLGLTRRTGYNWHNRYSLTLLYFRTFWRQTIDR
jgi:hypothetical protein